jgi:hypothetical protein
LINNSNLTDDDKLLYDYGHGTTDYGRTKVVMQSQDFVVFRTPGRSDWSGVGSRSYYPSHTVLIRKGEWCLKGIREEWYGRISKKAIKARLNEAQLKGRIVAKVTHQDKEPTRLYR